MTLKSILKLKQEGINMNLLKRNILSFTIAIILGFTITVNAQEFKVTNTALDPANSSDIIDYNLPSNMTPGQLETVSITLVNNGTTTWRKSENYHLRLFDPTDNSYMLNVWNLSRVELPNDIAPSERVVISFNVKAPSTSGKYELKWAMAKGDDYFGEYTDNKINVGGDNITVSSDSKSSNSEFISAIVPANMTAGEKYKIILSLQNKGDAVWQNASTNEFMISPIVESSDITYPGWNSDPIFLSTAIDPEQTSDVEFYVTAPEKSGVYNLQWMMKRGENYFGEKSDKYTVNVTGGSGALNDNKSYNASFMEQNVPSQMAFNKMQNVSVTVSNTGSKTWVVGSEQLVFIDAKKTPVTINMWNVGYIQLPKNVAPGELVTFDFEVKPTETGWQYFQCSMMTGNGELFGTPSQSVEVIISD